MKTIETIAIANDHGGLALKLELLKLLQAAGYKVIDFGSGTDDAVDYPDYAELAVAAVQNGQADAGLLICGSGIGMSMAANRHKGIRAALCHDTYTAGLTREHNDANVLVMGGRIVGVGLAAEIARIFFSTPFSHAERHVRRIGKFV